MQDAARQKPATDCRPTVACELDCLSRPFGQPSNIIHLMNKKLILPCLPALAACLALGLSTSRASSEILLQQLGSNEVTDFQDSFSNPPTKSDTVAVEGKFAGRMGEKLVMEAGNLVLRPNAIDSSKAPVIYLDRVDLSVENDVTVMFGGINVEGGRFYWGGKAVFGEEATQRPAILEIMPGPSKVEGQDLEFGPNGVVSVRFYTRDRVNKFVNHDPAVKPVQLSGKLHINSGAKLRLSFDENLQEALPEGEYTLIRATEATGSDPVVSQVQGTDAIDLSKLSCEIRGNELLLKVAP